MTTLDVPVQFDHYSQYGDFYPLKLRVDGYFFEEEVAGLDNQWRVYNTSKPNYHRKGLSLFSLDGSTSGEIDLNSILEYNNQHGTKYSEMSFNQPTENWKVLKSISRLFEGFESEIGRSHIIELGNGGFFPPHRDIGESVRLISILEGSTHSFNIMLDDKKLFFERYQFYFLNTRKTHSIFSFEESAKILVMNIAISPKSFQFFLENLMSK